MGIYLLVVSHLVPYHDITSGLVELLRSMFLLEIRQILF